MLPSILRGWPAIGLAGFRSIIGIHSLGFIGKDPIGLLSVGLRSGLSHRGTQNAIFRRSGGDVDAFAFQPIVLFISHEVLG
jgi:hypothetical protein